MWDPACIFCPMSSFSISPIVRSKIRAMTPVRGKDWQSCIHTPGLGSLIDSSSFCHAQASQLLGCDWSRAGDLRSQCLFESRFKRVDWIWITLPSWGFLWVGLLSSGAMDPWGDTETESSIWLYVCKAHLQVFERGGFLVTVRSGLGKIWFAYSEIHSVFQLFKWSYAHGVLLLSPQNNKHRRLSIHEILWQFFWSLPQVV